MVEQYPGQGARPHLLCIGGEDHHLRIPFLLALRARGLRVSAAGSAGASAFARAGLDYHPFRFERFVNPRADWVAVRALSRLLALVQPDIVQGFDTKPGLLVPLSSRARDVLAVRTINGMGWLFSSRAPVALALRPVYRLLHRLAARATAATVFQNRIDQAYFLDHGMAGRASSVLIPGSGIDIAGFERALAAAPPASAVREQLGVAAAEVVITVTRLTRQKGIATLLEAAALVHRTRPGARFLLVGPRESEGPLAIPQTAIDRHAPYVRALGRRDDVPSLLRLADVFAFPTEYREGVPRALLEAALAGVPIVTTRMPGCSDVVRDGWSGIEVPPRAPAALAAGIVALLEDRERAAAMARRAAQLVREEFGLELTASRYATLYHNLLARPPAGARGGP